MLSQLVILNPCAGRKQAGRRLGELLALLEADGVTAQLHETDAAGDAERFVAERAGRYARVVCIGGDGTLNEVISGVIRSGADVPIGYIPAGSTNDLAASHGLSRDLARAARDVVEGTAMPIDVGLVHGRCFVYTASFGIFTRASYGAPQAAKNALGHLAYIFEGARDLTRVRSWHVAVETDAGRFEDDYIFGTLSNSTSMGGVLKLDPSRVDLHDGKFELLFVRMPKNLGELVLAASALQARRYDHEMLRFISTPGVRICAEPDMPWTLDGEYQPGSESVQIENQHNAVRLIVPAKNAQGEETP